MSEFYVANHVTHDMVGPYKSEQEATKVGLLWFGANLNWATFSDYTEARKYAGRITPDEQARICTAEPMNKLIIPQEPEYHWAWIYWNYFGWNPRLMGV